MLVVASCTHSQASGGVKNSVGVHAIGWTVRMHMFSKVQHVILLGWVTLLRRMLTSNHDYSIYIMLYSVLHFVLSLYECGKK